MPVIPILLLLRGMALRCCALKLKLKLQLFWTGGTTSITIPYHSLAVTLLAGRTSLPITGKLWRVIAMSSKWLHRSCWGLYQSLWDCQLLALRMLSGNFYQNITISYYPACPQPHLTLGLQSHSDMGAITLLIQDHVGGLQIFKDSQWITVHPQSHAILVILADQMEIITNGKYRSAQHRAITNSSSPRLSVATFHDPAKTAKISPASELISNSSPPMYREVKYGDYVSSWYTKGPKGKRNIDALLVNS
ncbi:hypothetical protein OIU77_009597 [Salix suchowensis]|uniref:Fe2OG dioxygenase domain-containing protein n=1 Tax=Salix suchowensis TaxID=1278906 RepID=A0ABQ9AEQ9_9ROSI|nr:hypothetical protein OIU77_009597 [Salix suchowensis]